MAEWALHIGILDDVEFILEMVAYCIAWGVYVLDRADLYTVFTNYDDNNNGSVSLGNVCMESDDWKLAIAITTIYYVSYQNKHRAEGGWSLKPHFPPPPSQIIIIFFFKAPPSNF